MLYKNISGQKLGVYAHNKTTDEPQTGDALNITANVSIDGGALSPVTGAGGNPVELGNGVYIFDLTQAETNGDMLTFLSVSSTADVVIEPIIIYTSPSELTDIATAVWSAIVENGKSAQEHLIRIKAILGGNTQSNGTEFMNDAGDTIETTVAVDVNSNRTFS